MAVLHRHSRGAGLDGVQLVISDAREGLRQAIPAVLNGVTWRRCYVHFIRNARMYWLALPWEDGWN